MTTDQLTDRVARDLGLPLAGVRAVLRLAADGCTIPFIARYRKEQTGSLDETRVEAVVDAHASLLRLEQRRGHILRALGEAGVLDEALRAAVEGAGTLAALDDLYLPHQPKRRTRAQTAREAGLEPLAERLLAGAVAEPEAAAAAFVSAEKGVADAERALGGARDIIAERASEDPALRAELRALFASRAAIGSRAAAGFDPAQSAYRDYADYRAPIRNLPGHRLFALLRGQAAKELRVGLDIPAELALPIVERRFLSPLKGASAANRREVQIALADSWARLLQPSLANEAMAGLREAAGREAIGVFAANLRELLMAPPLRGKAVLAVDPGFRSGCKLAVLDATGRLLHHETIFPLEPRRAVDEAGRAVADLVRRHAVGAIAVGNGTGGREAVAFLRSLALDPAPPVCSVNESGASVYSAGELARQEFPDLDLTYRSAVSIGRRLQDPLSELIKIDPKSIGVGQYQHDVDQKDLRDKLDLTVQSCVNAVGVELNTAGAPLLRHVSGLNAKTAAAIVAHRDANGPFRDRRQVLDVPGVGPKAFEQAAGFLRIAGGDQPLDASAVHPERYGLVADMAALVGETPAGLIGGGAALGRLRDYAGRPECPVAAVVWNDILDELAKPGRDPRPSFEVHDFSPDVADIADLKPGMRLPGQVSNVAAFGAFVDIGVHVQGLVHVSRMSTEFVSDPQRVVKPGQWVTVTVLDVDRERKRIGLSLLPPGAD